MAARFWVGGGTNTNWNSSPVTNWAASSGGAGNQSVPGASDDVTFDGVGASSNGASIVSATITVLSLTFASGYTNTVTLNAIPSIAGNFTDNTAHSWAGSSGITITATSTITSGGKTFPNAIVFSGANTKTLVGNWTILGALTIFSSTTFNRTTAEIMNCAGLTMSNLCSGTATINLTGGTWTGNNILTNNLTFASGAAITIGAAVSYNTGTMTNNGATVTTTSSLLTLSGASTTLNTNGINWNNVTIGGNVTYTLNSLFTVLGTFTIPSNNITFAGTAGFTVGTLSCTTTAGVTLTFANTVTYTITTAFNAFSSRVGSILLFTSDHATNKAIITLNNGATCNVLASFTRIDASAGRAIWTFNGTITTCFNIFAITDLSFVVGKSQVIQGMSSY